MDWNSITPELEKKLNPAHVKPPSKFGPKGDYIEGWHAIAEANRIFGFGGWSYTIKTMTQDDLRQAKTARGDDQWQAAYTVIVTLTVGDVVREDVGFGSGFAKQVGDAVEGATKEAVTDALKRALRTFGNSFGLALYDKSRASVGFDEEKPDFAAIRDRLISAIGKRANKADLEELWKQEAEARHTLKTGSPAIYAEMEKAFKARAAEVEKPIIPDDGIPEFEYGAGA